MDFLYDSELKSDVILVTKDKKIHSHSLILSSHSQVFKMMFFGDNLSKTSEEVDVSHWETSTVETFFKAIYSFPELKIDVKEEKIVDLINMSHFYEVNEILDECWKKVKVMVDSEENKNLNTLCKIMNLLCLIKTKDFFYNGTKMCFKSILDHMNEPNFSEIISETLTEESIIFMLSENASYNFAVLVVFFYWTEKRKITQKHFELIENITWSFESEQVVKLYNIILKNKREDREWKRLSKKIKDNLLLASIALLSRSKNKKDKDRESPEIEDISPKRKMQHLGFIKKRERDRDRDRDSPEPAKKKLSTSPQNKTT